MVGANLARMVSTSVWLRPVAEEDLPLLRRFMVEPELLGLDWSGFVDAGTVRREFSANGFLGNDHGLLIVAADGEAAGHVSWRPVQHGGGGRCWGMGIALVPEWRGRGVGWRAHRALCDYLFAQSPVDRIEAGTRADNHAEQRALERAGFTREGVLRSAQFSHGAWHDLVVYSRLRQDPD
ncbi:GNAT family protein [Actinopolymorpha pittospori]